MLSNYLKESFLSKPKSKIMVEVGAAGPEHLSQSKPFKDDGWRCICVEANPNFAEMHRQYGNEIYEYAASSSDADDVDFHIASNCQAESFSSLGVSTSVCVGSGYGGKSSIQTNTVKVKVRKLDSILEEAGVDQIDYLIIDVEGWELEVMKGFSVSKYSPKVIVLECIGDATEYHNYMNEVGYYFDSYDETTGPNYVYVKR